MNEPTQPSIWQRSPLARCSRWLFSWRGIRRILIVLAWTATIIALLYGFENWRGRRAWDKARHQMEARGELLDFKAFIPERIAPEQNFAATPFVESWFVKGTYTNNDQRWGDNYTTVRGKASSQAGREANEKGSRRLTDLVAWEIAFEAIRSGTTNRHFASNRLDPESRARAAAAVLEGLKASDEKLTELRAASRRPYARYSINYKLDDPWGILLPHLAHVQTACERLGLRACARLALGKTDEALEDVKLILHIADSLKGEPILMSYLVRVACVQIAMQPIWEGLAGQRWSEAQLQQLQRQLQQYDFLADIDHPMDAERAAGILTADLLYRQKYTLGMLLDETASIRGFGGSLAGLLARVAPRGWYYREQVNHCRLHDRQMQGSFDVGQKRVFPGQIASNAKALEREIAGGRLGKTLNAVVHHQLLASLLLPSLGRIPLRGAMAQTAIDQAALACALERYRLANGQFPEKLEALVPQFISQVPKDLLGGEPYKYRRTSDGQYVLYSLGWNEKDDGGIPGPTLFHDKEGDWVWQFPQQQQSRQAQ